MSKSPNDRVEHVEEPVLETPAAHPTPDPSPAPQEIGPQVPEQDPAETAKNKLELGLIEQKLLEQRVKRARIERRERYRVTQEFIAFWTANIFGLGASVSGALKLMAPKISVLSGIDGQVALGVGLSLLLGPRIMNTIKIAADAWAREGK